MDRLDRNTIPKMRIQKILDVLFKDENSFRGHQYQIEKDSACMFDNIDPNQAYSLSCNCPKCSVR